MIFSEFQAKFLPEKLATFLPAMPQSTFFYFLNATLLSKIVIGSSGGKPDTQKLSVSAYLYE